MAAAQAAGLGVIVAGEEAATSEGIWRPFVFDGVSLFAAGVLWSIGRASLTDTRPPRTARAGSGRSGRP